MIPCSLPILAPQRGNFTLPDTMVHTCICEAPHSTLSTEQYLFSAPSLLHQVSEPRVDACPCLSCEPLDSSKQPSSYLYTCHYNHQPMHQLVLQRLEGIVRSAQLR